MAYSFQNETQILIQKQMAYEPVPMSLRPVIQEAIHSQSQQAEVSGLGLAIFA